jgi:hypothetical protein
MRFRTTVTALVMALVAALGAAILVGSVPAGAAVIDSGSEPVDETFDAGTCSAGGVDYDFEQHDVGVVSWRDSFRGPALGFGYDQAWFGTGTRDVSSTHTNLTTGLSWTSEFRTTTRDEHVLEVEGMTRLYLRVFTGHFVAYEPDGSVSARQDTRIEFTVRVDTAGTPDRDDDSEQFVGIVKSVGRNTVGDFCEEAVRLTVPGSA